MAYGDSVVDWLLSVWVVDRHTGDSAMKESAVQVMSGIRIMFFSL